MTFAVILLLSLWLVAMTCVAIVQTLRLRWQRLLTSAWETGCKEWEASAKEWQEVAIEALSDERDDAKRNARPEERRADAFVWFDNSAKMDTRN